MVKKKVHAWEKKKIRAFSMGERERDYFEEEGEEEEYEWSKGNEMKWEKSQNEDLYTTLSSLFSVCH